MQLPSEIIRTCTYKATLFKQKCKQCKMAQIQKKLLIMSWVVRVGRNPPSVLGDIHLIGIPAPRAEFIGAYYPFHGVGRHFTLTASLLNASASSSAASGGFFLRPDPTSQPAPRDATRPPRGWSFLRPIGFRARSRSPTRQPNRLAAQRHKQGLRNARERKKVGGGALLGSHRENVPNATERKCDYG